jgi:hypothetical protein
MGRGARPRTVAVVTQGESFGRLTAMADESAFRVLCRCVCGVEKSISVYQLRSGRTQSCGCLRKERATAAVVTHGQFRGGRRRAASGTYSSWQSMVNRCTNPTNKNFKEYGGRGITVCDRWRGRDGYSNFVEDMGERPDGMSIERVENSSGYEKSNCRWATPLEQAQNRRPWGSSRHA